MNIYIVITLWMCPMPCTGYKRQVKSDSLLRHTPFCLEMILEKMKLNEPWRQKVVVGRAALCCTMHPTLLSQQRIHKNWWQSGWPCQWPSMHVSKQTRRLTVCYSTFVVISEKLTMLLHVAWNSTSVHAQAVRLILIFLMYCPLSMHRRSDLYLFFNVFLALWWWWWWWWLFPRLQGFLEIVRPLIPRLRSLL